MKMIDMRLQHLHDLIPFRNLFKLVFGFAVSLQIIIILVNHLTGFYELNSVSQFISRVLLGSALSFIATFAVVYPDLFVIKFLNEKIGWHQRIFVRLLIQFFLTVLIGGIAAVGITYFSHVLNPYKEGLLINMSYNLMIFAVCNVILVIILEGWIFFIEGAKSSKRSRELEGQVTELRFEMLKKQIDSHFLFNSLNVLSGLIEKDAELAQDFIDEFSRLYRYVLESIDKRVVTVEDEINFARSYLYLQRMRYGEGLEFKVDLPSELLNGYLPPLSLQVVLENACKHNTVSINDPLVISITGNEGRLIVQNNIQPKISHSRGTRTGQSNLLKRYQMIGDMEPTFNVGTDNYTATLPIIFEEQK